jgi:hypothetical protein
VELLSIVGVSESGNAVLADQPGVFVINALTMGSLHAGETTAPMQLEQKRALSNVRARLIPEIGGRSPALRCFIKTNEFRRKTQRNHGVAATLTILGHRDRLNRSATPAPLGVAENATRVPASRALFANMNASIAPPSVMAPATAAPGTKFGRSVFKRDVVNVYGFPNGSVAVCCTVTVFVLC